MWIVGGACLESGGYTSCYRISVVIPVASRNLYSFSLQILIDNHARLAALYKINIPLHLGGEAHALGARRRAGGGGGRR